MTSSVKLYFVISSAAERSRNAVKYVYLNRSPRYSDQAVSMRRLSWVQWCLLPLVLVPYSQSAPMPSLPWATMLQHIAQFYRRALFCIRHYYNGHLVGCMRISPRITCK